SDFPVNETGGATVFNKYTLELRYPIISSSNISAHILAFGEAGNAWSGLDQYQPFNLKRSAGMGFRVHLPMFGTLGLDYGIGFDKKPSGTDSFLSRYGRLSLILGIEPN
ncbi:MAG: BamA/TamA family outer membrane protein, partial [Bacteroidota bacterium]